MNNNQHGGGFGGGEKPMFDATCSDCGKRCQVPFRPSGDRPIYCKDCFNKRREGSPASSGRGGSFSGNAPRQSPAPAKPQSSSGVRIEDVKRQLDAVSAKLDSVLQKLESAGGKSRKSTTPEKFSAKKPRKTGKASKR